MALLIKDAVRAPVRDFFEPAGAVETGDGTLVKESRLEVLVSFGTVRGRVEGRRP